MRQLSIIALLLLGYVSATLNFAPGSKDLGLGAPPTCALVGEECPLVGIQSCCGKKVAVCVSDGSGITSGIVQLKDCDDEQECTALENGGSGGCGDRVVGSGN